MLWRVIASYALGYIRIILGDAESFAVVAPFDDVLMM
jgi:hypothetical protein